MSTSKSKVTNAFLSLISDRSLSANLTDQEMIELLDYYLRESTYVRFKICDQDLSDNESYEFHTDTFTASATPSVEYTITDYPSTPNSDAITYVCTVDGSSASYTFDENTLTFTLASTPTAGSSVIVGYESVGVFGVDLTEEEIWILAHGMLISWFSSKLHRHESLRNKITHKDYTTFSPANLLDKMLQIKKEARTELRRLINSYSFESDFDGFN